MVYYVTSPTGGGCYIDDTATWVTTSSATTTTGNYWGDSWIMGETSTAGAYMQAAMIQQQCINQMLAQQQYTTSNPYLWTGQQLHRQPTPHEPTPADLEIIERHRLAKERLAAAHKKAEELLLSHLTPEQRETFVKNKWFVVQGKKQQYRINGTRYAGNIDIMDGEKVTARLCCHCTVDIPLHDHLLAQKIMLESAEDDFIKLANRRAA